MTLAFLPELAIPFILAPIWLLPFITAWYASSHGRSYKKWLILGFILPVISLFILASLPDKK